MSVRLKMSVRLNQGGFGFGFDFVAFYGWGEFDQVKAFGGYVEDAQVGDDAVYYGESCQGEGAVAEDLGGASLAVCSMTTRDAADAGDEVHGAAHALDHLAGDHPVGEVAALGDLHGAEDGEVDVAARIIAKESALEKKLAPGRVVTTSLPALMRSASHSASVG